MSEYNLSAIKEMLSAALNPSELSDLAFAINTNLPEEVENKTKSEQIRFVVEYAYSKGRMNILLDRLKQLNEYQYDQYKEKIFDMSDQDNSPIDTQPKGSESGAGPTFNINAGNVNVVAGDQNISGGTVAFRDQITNNQAGGDAQSAQELIAQLKELISQLDGQLDPKIAAQLKDDAETLEEEVNRDEPRSKWLNLSIDSLKEAAENVGEVAAPIAAAAVQVAKLLGPMLG